MYFTAHRIYVCAGKAMGSTRFEVRVTKNKRSLTLPAYIARAGKVLFLQTKTLSLQNLPAECELLLFVQLQTHWV